MRDERLGSADREEYAMNTPQAHTSGSLHPICSRSLEDQCSEYAEALNDIADILQLPTGATSADIVAAFRVSRDIVIEECAVAIQTQERGTRYQWMADSHFGTMTQEMAARLRRLKFSENTDYPHPKCG